MVKGDKVKGDKVEDREPFQRSARRAPGIHSFKPGDIAIDSSIDEASPGRGTRRTACLGTSVPRPDRMFSQGAVLNGDPASWQISIVIKTQVQIPDDLYRKVKRVAEEYEMSFAEVVRRSLERT